MRPSLPPNFLPRSGHGWFTVFLILFGAALYLSIGIGLNRYKYGMQASRPFRRLCPRCFDFLCRLPRRGGGRDSNPAAITHSRQRLARPKGAND